MTGTTHPVRAAQGQGGPHWWVANAKQANRPSTNTPTWLDQRPQPEVAPTPLTKAQVVDNKTIHFPAAPSHPAHLCVGPSHKLQKRERQRAKPTTARARGQTQQAPAKPQAHRHKPNPPQRNRAANSTLDRTPSFAKMFRKWWSTVRALMYN